MNDEVERTLSTIRSNSKCFVTAHARSRVVYILFAMVVLTQMPGCVSDKVKIDNPLLAYQQSMVRQGPQRRAGTEGMDVLSLLPQTTPEGQTTKKLNIGGEIHNLTIEEAIIRTLTNNPEIRAISFAPDISKEQIIKAAAEFDYIMFERFNYSEDDRPINTTDLFTLNATEGGQASSRLFEVGIKQKGVTGSQWSLGWSLRRNWDNVENRVLSTRHEPMLVLEIRQPLLRDAWEKFNLAGVNISKLNYRIAFADFHKKINEITVNVIAAYWALLQARREMEIQQRLLDKTLGTLKKLKDRSEIDVTSIQVKQTEASEKARQAVLIDARKKIIDIQDVLIQLMADKNMSLLNECEIVPTTKLNTQPVELDVLESLRLAMNNNPEIQQNRLRVEVARINVDIAKNQKLPSLELVASATSQGFASNASNANSQLFDGDYTSYVVGATLEFPLGNRGRRADLRRRELERSMAISALQNLSDSVATEVRERIRKIMAAHQQMQAQREAVEAAKIHLQALLDSEPIRGRLTPEFLLVKLQAQEELANAQRMETKAIVDFNTTLAALSKATGTVLELHQIQTSLPGISDEGIN